MSAGSTDIFAPIVLPWKGAEYSVSAEAQMRLAYVVEMALIGDSGRTFFEVITNPPMTSLAMAYGAGLRHAGVKVSDLEVLAEVRKVTKGDGTALDAALALIDQVLTATSPDGEIAGAAGGAGALDDAKKPAGD